MSPTAAQRLLLSCRPHNPFRFMLPLAASTARYGVRCFFPSTPPFRTFSRLLVSNLNQFPWLYALSNHYGFQ